MENTQRSLMIAEGTIQVGYSNNLPYPISAIAQGEDVTRNIYIRESNCRVNFHEALEEGRGKLMYTAVVVLTSMFLAKPIKLLYQFRELKSEYPEAYECDSTHGSYYSEFRYEALPLGLYDDFTNENNEVRDLVRALIGNSL
jgi:hypothetical protein